MRLIATFVFALLMAGSAHITIMAQDINHGLVAWYPLDGNALDFTAQARHGEIRNEVVPMPDRFDVPGAAMHFSGDNAWINIPGVDVSGPQMSINVFIKADNLSSGSYQNFLRQDGEGLPDFMLQFKTHKNKLAFGLHSGGRYSELLAPFNKSDFEGQWRMITATYDGSKMRLYVDATLVGEMNKSGPVRYSSRWNNIGRMTGREYFRGGIDDARYYNRALTIAEIKEIAGIRTETGGQSILVSGRVFNDRNNNCKPESGEDRLRQRLVHVMPSNVYLLTDELGVWQTNLDPGVYSARLLANDLWLGNCTSGGDIINFSVGQNDVEVSGLDFAQEAVELRQELDISLAGLAVRPGFETVYKIYYRNTGTVAFSGILHFTHDDWFEFLRADRPADIVNANQFSWYVENLAIGAAEVIEIRMRQSAQAPLGEIVCSRAWIEDKKPDQVLTHWQDEFCQEVRGSYDPNDINVKPGPVIADVLTDLSYMIRFQNQGTAPAAKVVVKQQLPLELQISKFQQGIVSHEYEFFIDEDRVATWIFDGIELPDDKTDEPASHGFIKYKILLHENTPAGQVVGCKAAIYFDFNDPVITNTAEVEIAQITTSVDGFSATDQQLTIFPNPAEKFVNLQLASPVDLRVKLMDLQGRVLQELNSLKRSNLRIDVSKLGSGQYLLQLELEGAVETHTINILR